MYQPYGIPFIALRFQLSPINMPHQKGGNRLDKAHTNFIWRFLDIMGQIVAASILWAVCCLPVITIGPSSTALYYAVVKSVRRRSIHRHRSIPDGGLDDSIRISAAVQILF